MPLPLSTIKTPFFAGFWLPAYRNFIYRPLGEQVTAILGDDHLFLDARGARAVFRALPGFEREHHAFFQRLVLAGEALGEDRPLPQRQADAVAVLQQKRLGLVAVAEILGVPQNVEVVAISPLGYPAAEGGAAKRKEPAEFVFYDKYRG